MACAAAHAHDPTTVVTHGDGVAVASLCTDGGYWLMVTARPEAKPWTRKRLRPSDETDRISEGLLWGETARDREHLWYRIEGVPETWSIPNGRTHTRTLLILRAREDLHLRLWLPGDDRSGPGRHVDISQLTAARMWVNVILC